MQRPGTLAIGMGLFFFIIIIINNNKYYFLPVQWVTAAVPNMPAMWLPRLGSSMFLLPDKSDFSGLRGI